MTEVLFYHLERASLESVLPGLLEKTLERGWKAVVRCGSRETVTRLDEILWTYSDDSFLPHAADVERACDQPVWLTDGADTPNSADLLFLVDNASTNADAIGSFVRCVTIFDGGDAGAVTAARGFWKTVKAAGHDATFWKQTPQGRWEKQSN
jgi:DNA polymerase-3 subunit chi